jgi:hypothetical protein
MASDRERILVNIAALLAEEVCRLQRMPEVQERLSSPHEHIHVRVVDGSFPRPAYKKGDLVLCQTSTGIQQNPFLVSFIEEVGCLGDPHGLLLREIGTTATSNYGNERFGIITGIPEKFLWEGEKQKFVTKLMKALRKFPMGHHRYRGTTFPADGVAGVTIGEEFGGLARPTKPYVMTIKFDRQTTIKAIVAQMTEQGLTTRAFEPEEPV